jgi:hypothetical protein
MVFKPVKMFTFAGILVTILPMNDQLLYSCLYGSRLYGTQTPTSDLDWKHIVLPNLDQLLLGYTVTNKEKKTNTARNVRNTQDDVDETFIPLQVFARDYYMGQTYALELAWSIDGDHALQAFTTAQAEPTFWYQTTGDRKHLMFYQFTRELRDRFLTSNVKAMMGYAVNQASLYSFKGERLNCVNEVNALFLQVDKSIYGSTVDGVAEWTVAEIFAIGFFKYQFNEIATKYPKYFRIADYDIGGGVIKPCFMLLEKCLPFTNTYEHTMRMLTAIKGKYGSRAQDAAATAGSETKTVDWKATMHALRIVDQGIQLLTEHRMTFPFEQPYVDKLLSIKRGEVPLEEVTEELNAKLDNLKNLEAASTLLPASQARRAELDVWLAAWLRRFYNLGKA